MIKYIYLFTKYFIMVIMSIIAIFYFCFLNVEVKLEWYGFVDVVTRDDFEEYQECNSADLYNMRSGEA